MRLFLKFFIFLSISSFAKANGGSIDSYLRQMPNDIIIGNQDAKIQIIEYVSFSCHHCGYFHNNIFPRIKEKYIDTGKVKWISRLFVSDKISMHGALLALCNKKQYYAFLDVLFKKQNIWPYSDDYYEILSNIALLAGLSQQNYEKCVNNVDMQNALIDQRMIASNILKIKGTPSIFIQNEFLDNFDLEHIQAKIEQYDNESKNKR